MQFRHAVSVVVGIRDSATTLSRSDLRRIVRHPSMQFGVPSPSVSVSTTTATTGTRAILQRSFGTREAVAVRRRPNRYRPQPQPQIPERAFNGSFGQPSKQLGVPSPSVSCQQYRSRSTRPIFQRIVRETVVAVRPAVTGRVGVRDTAPH